MGEVRREGKEEAMMKVRVEEISPRGDEERGGTSELYKAALDNNLEEVKRILEENKRKGESVRTEWEENPLRAVIHAAKTRVSVADALLRHCGHELLLTPRDSTTNTLLHLAVKRGKEKLAVFFLRYLAQLSPDTLPPYVVSTHHPSCFLPPLPPSTTHCFLDAVNHDGQTLLHLALAPAHPLLNVPLPPYAKQCFVDAVNNEGQTVLHLAVACEPPLLDVVEEIVSTKQLKINTKDKKGQTVFDVIHDKCKKCTFHNKDWKKLWRISTLLRGFDAKTSSRDAKGNAKLEDYEDEEDVIKDAKPKPGEALIKNEDAWNTTTNTILLISTLAFTLVFAAIFTVPQTLAPSDTISGNTTTSNGDMGPTRIIIESLHASLGKNIAFKVFIVSLTLASVVMIFVILVVVLTVSSEYGVRALILCFSWFCLMIMWFALMVAYAIAIWIYMGYFFTSILIACSIFLALIFLFFTYCFDLWKHFWDSLSHLLSLTLLHGFVATLLQSYLPQGCAHAILHVLPFEKF